MSHNLNIIFLLLGAFQGALLSMYFLRRVDKNVSNIYFTAFLLAVGLQLTFKVLSKGWLMDHVLFGYLMSYKLPYLVAPLFYLFIRSEKENKIYATDLLHFIPFVVVSLPLLFPATSFNILLYPPYIHLVPQLIVLALYGYLSLQKGNLRLRIFIKLVIFSEVIIAITLAAMHYYYGIFPDVRWLFASLTLLIYWISYKSLADPGYFESLREQSYQLNPIRRNKKYANSTLKAQEAAAIEKKLMELINKEKVYLQTSLTLDSMAEMVGVSRHHISQVINERMGKTFNELIASARLQEVCQRLSNPANDIYTITAIALDSGFNSASGFNDIFKKNYGITPSEFRKQNLKKKSA